MEWHLESVILGMRQIKFQIYTNCELLAHTTAPPKGILFRPFPQKDKKANKYSHSI